VPDNTDFEAAGWVSITASNGNTYYAPVWASEGE
jgi:hypothetical protein